MKKKGKPEIRFQGNANDWEAHKVGQYYEFRNGLNKGREFFGSGTPIVNFTDVFHNRGLFSDNLNGRVALERSEIQNYEVRKGDIFFTRTSETIEEIGYPSVMLDDTKDTVFSGFVLRGRCILEEDPLDDFFKKYVFFTNAFRAEMVKKSSMTTRALTSGTAIKEMEFIYPSDKEEQHKIGEFITNIDNLIAFYQHEYDKLINIKKNMLEKMFPQHGSSVPEIRFAGFSGQWEQHKLGDVLDDLYNGQTPSRFKDSYWNGEISWLSSGELNRGIVYESIETITHEGKESAHLRIVPKGTFVMAITGLEAAGTRGNCAILGFDTTLNQSCMALFPKKNMLTPEFLFQWYRMVGEEYGIKYTQGTKQQSYNAEIIKDLDICLPKLPEQQKISSVLQKVDNFIVLHQRKIEKLRNIKAACMDKMFV